MDVDNIFHICWSKGVSWFVANVIFPKSRSQWTYNQNQCPGHSSLLPSWIKNIFHIKIIIVVHYLRICQDLNQWFYFQGNGHREHKDKPSFVSRNNPLLPRWIWIIFYTIVVHEQRVCHNCEQGHICNGQGQSEYIAKIRVRAITPYCHVGFE